MVNAKRLPLRLAGILLAALSLAADAQCQVTTTITDNLFGPDGSPAVGTVTAKAHQTFTAADNTVVAQGTAISATIGSNGSFTIQLVPTIGAAPIGATYDVEYASPLTRVAETWAVPQSGIPVKLTSVRVVWPKSLQIFSIATTSFNLEAPTVADSGNFSWEPSNNIRVTRVGCYVTGASATVTVNLDERTEAAPSTSGTSILSTPLVCGNTFASSTTFANTDIGVRSPVALLISGTTGTPAVLHIFVEYRLKLT